MDAVYVGVWVEDAGLTTPEAVEAAIRACLLDAGYPTGEWAPETPAPEPMGDGIGWAGTIDMGGSAWALLQEDGVLAHQAHGVYVEGQMP